MQQLNHLSVVSASINILLIIHTNYQCLWNNPLVTSNNQIQFSLNTFPVIIYFFTRMNIYISLISSKFSFQFEYSVSLSLFNRCLTCISMFYASDNFYNSIKNSTGFQYNKKISCYLKQDMIIIRWSITFLYSLHW